MRVLFEGTGNLRAFSARSGAGGQSVLALADEAVKIDGFDENDRKELIQRGMAAAARIVQADAKKRVRVKTGGLRRSIKVEAPPTVKVSFGRGRAARVERADFARLVVNAPHWYLIEFGRKAGSKYRDDGQFGIGLDDYPPAPAYPYLQPALNATIDQQFDICINAMRTAWIQLLKTRARRI